MKFILKFTLLLFVTFSNTLWAAEDSAALKNLESALNKIQDQILGTKIIIAGKEDEHEQAVATNDATEIASTLAAVEERKNHLANLLQALHRVQKSISELENQNTTGGIRTQTTDSQVEGTTISFSKILLPGWNAFSIPVNKSILSSSPKLGDHSLVWGYDSLTNQWVKNPEKILPGKGYFILYTGQGGYKIDFSGASFSTKLDTMIKKSKHWYFLGASNKIESIDYNKYVVLKYELQTYKKNPSTIETGDTFWAYRR